MELTATSLGRQLTKSGVITHWEMALSAIAGRNACPWQCIGRTPWCVLAERGGRRGPFGFAQGRLYDCAGASLREVPAPLRMTSLRLVAEA